MEYVYELDHVYEKDGEEDVKSIGIFSSTEKAKEARAMLITKPGFRDHPKKHFKLIKQKLIKWVG